MGPFQGWWIKPLWIESSVLDQPRSLTHGPNSERAVFPCRTVCRQSVLATALAWIFTESPGKNVNRRWYFWFAVSNSGKIWNGKGRE